MGKVPGMTSTRILMADDDPVLLALGAESLGAEGYDVSSVENGAAALDLVQREPFDLIVLDIEMPEMSGLAALREIRASEDEALATVPVIMLTGLNDEDAIRACYDSGATSYIAKPVNWLNICHQVAFILKAGEDAQALRKAHARAEERSYAKDVALMMLRHELRSPLHVIKGFSSLLADTLGERLKDEENHALTMIGNAVDSMTGKMSRLFLYADILSGDFPRIKDYTTARRVIDRAISSVAEHADECGIAVEVETADGPPLEIRADEEKLAFGIAELLDNALKFGTQGSVVKLRCVPSDTTRSVAFIVENAGKAIAEDDTSRLFDAFEQGDSGHSRESIGLGLGLTVARAIARHHGGTASITNGDNGSVVAELTIADGIGDLAAVA